MFSIKIGKSKFISYDMRRIQEMGADAQEELSDMAHKFVNVFCSQSGDISDTVHFPKLLQVRDSDNISEEYMQILQNRLHQFESKYQDVEIFCTEFQLFSNAFSVDFKYVPSRYQLELLKLQSDDLLKDKYKHKQSLVDF